MSNDPKDAVVDLSKLAISQMQTSTIPMPISTSISTPVVVGNPPNSSSSSLITSCNEGANSMIRSVSFGQDHNTKK